MISKKSNLAFVLVLISVLALSFASVNAQDTATVTVQDVTGGTTDVTGTTTYSAGSTVTITATAEGGFAFQNFVVSPSDGSGDMLIYDNPVTFTVQGGVTYIVVPVFVAPLPIPGLPPATDLTTAAIVIIFPSAGGTTIPAPGTYAMTDASAFNLTAMPTEGWQFAYWTICGNPTPHGTEPINWTPTDNPYNVNHGYGDTYRYQAIFTPVGSSPPPTTGPTATSAPGGGIGGLSTEMWIIIGLVVVIVVILIGFGVFASRRRHP